MLRFEIQLSSMLLNDVQRRSFYADITVAHRTWFASWWPRPFYVAGVQKPFLTCGTRTTASNHWAPDYPHEMLWTLARCGAGAQLGERAG